MVYHLVLTLLQYCLVYKIINLQRERERESRGQPLNMDPSPIKLRDILCRGREGEEEEGTQYNLTMVYTLHTYIHPFSTPQTTHTPSLSQRKHRMLGIAYIQNFKIIQMDLVIVFGPGHCIGKISLYCFCVLLMHSVFFYFVRSSFVNDPFRSFYFNR